MSTIYEINMSNAQADVNTGRVKQNSKIVEVFSALSAGKRPEVDDKTLDKSVATIKELSSKAIDGDNAARSEINSIIRFSIEPKLLEVVRLFDFMGTYRTCFECVAWFGSVGLLALGREHPGTNLPAVYFAVARPIRCGYCHTGLDEVCGRGWKEAPLHITE